MNSVSFQGKTIFSVNPKAYDSIYDPVKQACINIGKNNNRRLLKHSTYVFNTEPENLTVIVRNSNDGFFRYIPVEGNHRNIFGEIAEQINLLKNSAKKEPLTAWIFGGTKIESQLGEKVIKTLNEAAEVVCDRPDIDTSILVGSKLGEERFILRPGVNQLKIEFDKSINNKSNIKGELENLFDIVEFNNTEFVNKI